VVAVRSRLLGCEVLFAGDGAALAPGESRPVYRVAELLELIRSGITSAGLRGIHKAKMALAGVVLPEDVAPPWPTG
jgi:hypothetical protein